jgi:4-deoxy-L-threo-5-hexosulose-uronate ketol-isomerase
MEAGWLDKNNFHQHLKTIMVEPKIIGPERTGETKSPEERRFDAKVQIPRTDDYRLVEMFDALPVMNKREPIITENNSTFKFLRFARIVLDPKLDGYKTQTIQTTNEELVFYVNRGNVTVNVDNESIDLSVGDVVYVGTNQTVQLSTNSFTDVSEFRAIDCNTSYPIQVIKHKDLEKTELAATLGSKRPMSERTVFKLVDGANVQACRLLFGDTFMKQPGGVGSYPPHFHGPDGEYGFGNDAKEEIYHFRVQSTIPNDTGYVLQNCSQPGEDIGIYTHIFDEQAINVTHGYHDTIAPPAIEFMFTWCLASFTEGRRDWAEVLNKPGYEGEW